MTTRTRRRNDADGDTGLPVTNPTTGEVVDTVPLLDAEDVAGCTATETC